MTKWGSALPIMTAYASHRKTGLPRGIWKEGDGLTGKHKSISDCLAPAKKPRIDSPTQIFYSLNPKIPIPPDSSTKSPLKPSITPLARQCVYVLSFRSPPSPHRTFIKFDVHKPTSIQKATPLSHDNEMASRDSLSALCYVCRLIDLYALYKPSSFHPPAI